MDINEDAAEWAWMGVDKLASSRHFDKIYHRIPNPFSSGSKPAKDRRRDRSSSSYDSYSDSDSYERPRQMSKNEKYAKDKDYRDARRDYETDRERRSRRKSRYDDRYYRSPSRDLIDRRDRYELTEDRDGRSRRRAATVGAAAATGAALGAYGSRSRPGAASPANTDGPADDERFETLEEARERRSREDFVRSYVETDAFSNTPRIGPHLPTVEDGESTPAPSEPLKQPAYPARTVVHPRELSPPLTGHHAGESLRSQQSPQNQGQLVRSPPQRIPYRPGMYFPPPPTGPPPQGIAIVPPGASPTLPPSGKAGPSAATGGFAPPLTARTDALPPPPLHPPPTGTGFGPGPILGAAPGPTRGTSMWPQYDERSRFRGVQFGPSEYRSSRDRRSHRHRDNASSTDSEEPIARDRDRGKGISGKGLASAVLGAVAGGLVGSDLTRGDGLATVGAAVAGALGAREVERGWERRRDGKRRGERDGRYDGYDKEDKYDRYGNDRYGNDKYGNDKYGNDKYDKYGERRRRRSR
ncbi:hypothetical protein K490DRAFT_63027 [Saccharata proteae CBS 121410]|uniref:Glycine zipper 2TM domain-containing protein n=1 Tax=Saccharata proteae CBS 121410 TaxID=1314787 RepID=A0A9P4HVY3_9PEZI|nr:hypothetical protein K490DRAFT_63027 [Saccharata proteae CBS 121410]